MQICGVCGQEMQWCNCTDKDLLAAASGSQQGGVAIIDWLDALAERWERTSSELYIASAEGSDGRSDRIAANVWKQASKELRAEMERASNAPFSCGEPEK